MKIAGESLIEIPAHKILRRAVVCIEAVSIEMYLAAFVNLPPLHKLIAVDPV